MSELRFVHCAIPTAALNGETDLPAWYKAARPPHFASELDEDDGLFLNYGGVWCCHPYRDQNQYGEELKDADHLWAILENEHLRAVFSPEGGGKLWSLLDKHTGKDLLFANPVDRPRNLALRNAWTSGGVEWNCGWLGHHPHTRDTMFAARVQDENGEPALRMYEYERVRNVTYQMDFSLPAGSRVLICRMRIVNPNEEPIPMYWWSNMAVPEIEGARVVIPAHATYTNINSTVIKVPIPVPDYSHVKVKMPDTAGAFDVTYPTNTPVSIDYFWTLDKTDRPFTCQLDREGYGLFQASTARLKGRKLFVWGQGPGGARWQEFLSGNGCPGRYVEIQAGLACSQYESLPMPPRTAWEWVEVYGAMHADPAKVHGDWDGAIAEVGARIDEIASSAWLEAKLNASRAAALTPAAELVTRGSAWGALENARRAAAGAEPVTPHLDFGAMGEEQAPWQALLADGELPAGDPATAPVSWQARPEWVELLLAASEKAPNWLVSCQLGGACLTAGNPAEGALWFRRSHSECPNAWALFGISCCALLEQDMDTAAEYALKAHEALPAHDALALHAITVLHRAGRYADLVALEAALTDASRAQPRVRMLTASACVRTGDLARAEAILWENGGLIVPDMQEGENFITGLWLDLEEAKAARDGIPFDRAAAEPPHIFDFRMFAPKKKV